MKALDKLDDIQKVARVATAIAQADSSECGELAVHSWEQIREGMDELMFYRRSCGMVTLICCELWGCSVTISCGTETVRVTRGSVWMVLQTEEAGDFIECMASEATDPMPPREVRELVEW